jgi:hypothetical protein
MRLAGASTSRAICGTDELSGRVNYFIGWDASRWRRNIPTFRKVKYSAVYPGIDLIYHGGGGGLEYDFVVAPKADPSRIELAFQGATGLSIDRSGDLVVKVARESVRWRQPVLYQEISGRRRPVAGRFILRGAGRVGFSVARYDTRRALVIDPVFAYSTYFASSDPSAIAVDASGSAYVAGNITSAGFPAHERGHSEGIDAFVAKLDPKGSQLLYVTYFGGSGFIQPSGIAVDGTGNAYIAGFTWAPDIPIVNGFQTTFGGMTDAFLAKISTGGSELMYSTYLGGESLDNAHGVAVAKDGTAYVCGYSLSADFPTRLALPSPESTPGGGFVARIATTEVGPASLLSSTFLAGAVAIDAVAVGTSGRFYVTGSASSSYLPVVNAYQATNTTKRAGFLSAFVPDGSRLFYSSYLCGDLPPFSLRGHSGAGATRMALGPDETVYLGGLFEINSTPIPGHVRPFVARFDCNAAGGSSVLSGSTFAVEQGNSSVVGVAADGLGNALFAMNHSSVQGDFIRVYRIDPNGRSIEFSEMFGGSVSGYQYRKEPFAVATGLTADADGNAYITGNTANRDFPITANAYQTRQPLNAAFVSKLPTWQRLDADGARLPGLVFQNRISGEMIYWAMRGDHEVTFDHLNPAQPGADWKAVGTADFNGDGTNDLLFQNSRTGDLAYWVMNGASAAQIGRITPRNPGPNMKVVGVADFDGDGHPDILFQDCVTGDLNLWYMRGTTRVSASSTRPAQPGLGWRIVAVGDLNGDGRADILLQQVTSGNLYAWYMQNGKLYASRGLTPNNPGPGWKVLGLADINGDGRPVILFQNAETSSLAYWVMNGGVAVTIAQPTPSTTGDSRWRLVGAK